MSRQMIARWVMEDNQQRQIDRVYLAKQYVPKVNELPIHGDDYKNFGINALLASNIYINDYFRTLYEIMDFTDILEEFDREVKHIEPFTTGSKIEPSTAFCILLKLFLYRLSAMQMAEMLSHHNPLIRGIGIIYLRYTLPPISLWNWFALYIDDQQEFCPFSDKKIKITFGQFIRDIINDQKYRGTIFPRIPIQLDRELKANALKCEAIMKHKSENIKFINLLHIGSEVKSCYSYDLQFYDAMITDVYDYKNFKVKYTEYGNEETRSVYLLDFDAIIEAYKNSQKQSSKVDTTSNSKKKRDVSPSGHHKRRHSRSRSRSRSRRHRSKSKSKKHHRGHRRHSKSNSKSRSRTKSRSRSHRHHSRSRSKSTSISIDLNNIDPTKEKDLFIKLVRQKDREATLAHGNKYANTVKSAKREMHMPLERYTNRERSQSMSPIRETVVLDDKKEEEVVKPKVESEEIKKLKEKYSFSVDDNTNTLSSEIPTVMRLG